MTAGFEPLGAPFKRRIRVPGSKSITIRALVAASLANGRSHIYDALRADDTAATIDALRSFGVAIDDRSEPLVVEGRGGSLEEPRGTIDARDSGLTARISIALAALVEGETLIDGSERLRERPVAPLLDLLEAQGVEVESRQGRLPVRVRSYRGLWGGEMTLAEAPTSQLVTAALMIGPMASHPTTLRASTELGSAGYVDLTLSVMGSFGARATSTFLGYEIEPSGYEPADFTVEPDASSAVYPMVAAAITASTVEIDGLRMRSIQPDVAIAGHLQAMGCSVQDGSNGLSLTGPEEGLTGLDVDLSDAPDGAMALAVACLFADGESRIRGLGSLRHKESDRVAALVDGFTRIGATVTVLGDDLVVAGPPAAGGTIDSHGDHRVAMALSLAGLRVRGVELTDPDVVSKTWPGFWEDMEDLLSRDRGARSEL